MNLEILVPDGVVLATPIRALRAADASGLFGLWPHHEDFATLLVPCVLSLFGNVMSEELVIAVLLSIAGLLVPVPLMMLAVITGLVQAYLFAVLTVVYLSAAVRAHQP